MNKKIIIPIVLLLFLIVTTAYASFSDVSESHENSDAIGFVESEGIVEGYSDGTYKPDNRINRAEFTKIVVEAEFTNDQIDSCISNNTGLWGFPDVPESEWFAKYVCLAQIEGIVGGYPDGTYKPADEISIVEASKIIVNTFGYTVGTDDIWYRPFMVELSDRNALPKSITSFEQNITRAEMAEMIYRLLETITTKESTSYDELAGIVENPVSTIKEFDIVAKRFFFTPSTITVDLGDTVIINIESNDVSHGFSITQFGVSEVINPGETTRVEFLADQAGTFSFFCTVVCGSGHSSMQGTFIVND